MYGSVNQLGQYDIRNSPGNRSYTVMLQQKTHHFFPSAGSNHHQHSLHLTTDRWPGWVGLGGSVEYQDSIPINGHTSQQPMTFSTTSFVQYLKLEWR